MNRLVKLLTFALIFATKNAYTFSMTEEEQVALATERSVQDQQRSTSDWRTLGYEAKERAEEKIEHETKIESDSSKKIVEINKFRSQCLEKHIPTVLSNLVQEYDPIKDWECEATYKEPYDTWQFHTSASINTICPLLENKLALMSYNTIKILDLTTNQCVATLKDRDGENSIYSLCPLTENRLASVSYGNTIKVWNMNNSQCIKAFNFDTYPRIETICSLPENKLAAGFGSFSDPSDDNYIITIADLDSGQCITILQGHTDDVCSLCSLPNNRLASGSADKTIKIWDLKTNKCIATLIGHTHSVTSLCLLSGNKLASGSWDDTIKIWDLKTNECISTLIGHTNPVISLCSLPGNKLASGSWDKTIKIWDLKTNKCFATLKGHDDRVKTLCLLPENKLISGSYNNTIKIWHYSIYLLIYEQPMNPKKRRHSI